MASDPRIPIQRFVDEVQDQHKVDVIDEVFAENFYNHFSTTGVSTGRDGVHLLTHEMRKAIPDLRAQAEATYVDGDMVITRKTFSGTHSGEWFGNTPGNGEKVKFSVIDIMRVDDDNKIVEHWAGLVNPLFTADVDG